MQTKTGGSRECSFPFTELEAALFFLKKLPKERQHAFYALLGYSDIKSAKAFLKICTC